MIARANTRVSILRGTATNEHGDVVDTITAVRTDIPASLIEANRRTYLPAEGASRVARTHICRLTAGTDVRKGDRIKDQTTNRIYQILDLNENPGSPAHMPDIVIQLATTT